MVRMLRESKYMEIKRNTPDVKTAGKWKAVAETDDILFSLTHRDIAGAT